MSDTDVMIAVALVCMTGVYLGFAWLLCADYSRRICHATTERDTLKGRVAELEKEVARWKSIASLDTPDGNYEAAQHWFECYRQEENKVRELQIRIKELESKLSELQKRYHLEPTKIDSLIKSLEETPVDWK